MQEAELVVRIPKIWLTELPKRHEISIRMLDRRPAGRQGVRDLIEITGRQEELEAAMAALKVDPWVKSFDLDFVEPSKLVGEVVTHKCLACAALVGSRVYLVSASTRRDGSLLWRLMIKSRTEIKRLMVRLERVGCAAELKKISAIDEREVLTDRQKEITIMAFDKGYFDTPRRIKLKELSSLTGVSQATLSEILRKGQRRILIDYLRDRGRAL